MKQSTGRLLSAAVAALLAALAPVTARAHGEEGTFEVASVDPADDLSVDYDLFLTYDNDGDAAVGATVTLTGRGPRGAAIGPVPLAPTGESGHYGGTVAFPSAGRWRVRISATSPRALLTRTEVVGPVAVPTTPTPTTTAAPSTAALSTTTVAPTVPGTAAPSPASTSPPPTTATSTPLTTAAVDSSTPAAAGGGGGADGGGGGGAWVWIAAVVAVAALALTVLVRRRSAA